MRLNLLPRDALDNVLSRLSMSDILSLARASHLLTAALRPYLEDAHVRLDPPCTAHLLHPHSRVGLHLRRLSIHSPLPLADLHLLGRACRNLAAVSFHNLPNGLAPHHLHRFLSQVGPALTLFSAQFCAALSGPLLLPALARHCPRLTHLHLRFAPRVYAPHLDYLLSRVGHQLRVLDLDSCVGLDDAVLAAVIHRCPLLEHLCVGGAEDLGDDAVLALSESPCATTLRHLDIRGCMNVTDVGVFSVATSFTHLTHLNVWRVCLTSYAIRAVAEGLGERLETLIMGDCIGIDDTALMSIADNCDTLINLEMAGLKGVTDAGVMALFDANKTGRSMLETLTIDGCEGISEASVLAAAGLWDGPWSWSPNDAGGACRGQNWGTEPVKEETDDELQQRHEDDDHYYSDYGFSDDKASSESSDGNITFAASAGLDADNDSQRCSAQVQDGWGYAYEVESFEPTANVSYLRKLSAIGARKIRQALWGRIREARPDLELRVDIVVDCMEEDQICEGSDSGLEGEYEAEIGYYFAQCSGEDEWFYDGRRQEKDVGELHGVVSLTTATEIDTQARSCAKYRVAAGLEQFSLS